MITRTFPQLFLVIVPALIQPANLPARPRSTWDSKYSAWTDENGDQEDFYNSVRLLNSSKDALPNINSNKIPVNLRAIFLHAQLFGGSKDLCSALTYERPTDRSVL